MPAHTEDTAAPVSEEALEERLSRPTEALTTDLAGLEGDILVLGAGGKMGPTLARMARRALDAAGKADSKVLAVARFTDAAARAGLEANGVKTIAADLSDRSQVNALPDAANIVYMAGQKFGTSDAPDVTWMMNAYVPSLIGERYGQSAERPRLVVFSTGCVYANVAVGSGGSREADALEPLGDYANSCIARERLFTYFAKKAGIPTILFRLNYAIDLRYGVLVDVARKVLSGEPIDVTMGHANVIWQGDANAIALRSLLHAGVPPVALNVTGPETVSIRNAASQFGLLFGRQPIIIGQEADTALLSNSARSNALFGYPTVPLDAMIGWVADWLQRGGRLLGKPTHYETRDGKY